MTIKSNSVLAIAREIYVFKKEANLQEIIKGFQCLRQHIPILITFYYIILEFCFIPALHCFCYLHHVHYINWNIISFFCMSVFLNKYVSSSGSVCSFHNKTKHQTWKLSLPMPLLRLWRGMSLYHRSEYQLPTIADVTINKVKWKLLCSILSVGILKILHWRHNDFVTKMFRCYC